MASLKKQFFAIFISISLTACSSQINSSSTATPQQASSKYQKKEPSPGFDNLLMMLGMAVLFGVIFATAPKEAYK